MNDTPGTSRPIEVVKLGGSLLDMSHWPGQLTGWLNTKTGKNLAIVVGGGKTADCIRRIDQQHHLGDEAAHWLAIRAMQLNTFIVDQLLDNTVVVCHPTECQSAFAQNKITLIDPFRWLIDSEQSRGPIPHRWSFTSDSIAARIANDLSAHTLTLLKSADPPGDGSLTAACQSGYVDSEFCKASQAIDRIEAVNLLQLDPKPFVLR